MTSLGGAHPDRQAGVGEGAATADGGRPAGATGTQLETVRWRSWPARLIAVPILGYRRGISPLLGPRCRFEPPCSLYAVEALRRHGALKGSWLAARRLARCQPFHPGGYDPVPHCSKPDPRVSTSRGVARGDS